MGINAFSMGTYLRQRAGFFFLLRHCAAASESLVEDQVTVKDEFSV